MCPVCSIVYHFVVLSSVYTRLGLGASDVYVRRLAVKAICSTADNVPGLQVCIEGAGAESLRGTLHVLVYDLYHHVGDHMRRHAQTQGVEGDYHDHSSLRALI